MFGQNGVMRIGIADVKLQISVQTDNYFAQFRIHNCGSRDFFVNLHTATGKEGIMTT